MKVFEDYLMFFTSKEKRIFYNKWLRPVSSSEFRTGAQLVHNQLKNADVEYWLLDASNCNTPARDDQEWVIAEMCKLMDPENGAIRKLALVKSKDVFFELVVDTFQQRLEQFCDKDINMHHFSSVPEAYTWLLTPPSPVPTASPLAEPSPL